MLKRTVLFAAAAALAVALAPAAASAKPKGSGKHVHLHHHHKHHHHRHAHRWHRHYKTIIVGTGAATSYAAYSAATGSCNCLTKSYLGNGTVVFKDVCTQEMAMSPAGGKQAELR
jgi:hypothetical protein